MAVSVQDDNSADSVRASVEELVGQRVGPYLSFNAVNRAQVWQWCSAMGEHSPLYLDDSYRASTEFRNSTVVAPPAMMQMWTMRDVNMEYAPGSSQEHPYPIMRDLAQLGFPDNVAISYDIRFHRYLVEGDRAHHYKSVVNISELKSTALGQGYFFTDRMEYLDQNGQLFAEALITYFQYRAADKPDARAPATGSPAAASPAAGPPAAGPPAAGPPAAGSPAAASQDAGNHTDTGTGPWQSNFSDLHSGQVCAGDTLPELIIPITHKLIIAGAIATQDFEPVHHNVPAAQAAAMPDIFMNILTSCGLCARYLSDWAGPGSRLQRLQLRLMAPNTPGDTMTLQGQVSEIENSSVSVEFSGVNAMGPHVMGSATLALAS